MNKVIVNEQKTQVMDLIFFMNLFNVLIAGPLIALKSDLSFIVPQNGRRIFFTRTTLGWVLSLLYVLGNTLVPITV